MRSVGVTGTNGKTTTTTWVAAALASLHAPVFRATTLGCFVGAERLDVSEERGYEKFLESARAAAARGARFAAVELTSQALWSGVARAWPCEVGVFTNLSHDHLDAHGDAEHYLACKAQLFLSLARGSTAVLNACDAVFPLLREVLSPDVRCSTYGYAARGAALAALDCEIIDVRVAWSGTTMTFRDAKKKVDARVSLRAIGHVFAENAAAAWLAAVAMGVPAGDAIAAISREPAPPGRFEVLHDRPHVVVDYAHTPDALARTCRTARSLASEDGGALTVVFGAGGGRDHGKRPHMGRAARIADRIILTSDNPRDEDPEKIVEMIREGTGGANVSVEMDRRQAIARAVLDAGERDVVVVCGKGHETEQVVAGETRRFSDHEAVVDAVRARGDHR